MKFELESFRVGDLYYSQDVVRQVREISKALIAYGQSRTDWQKHTSTSYLVSGLPGQGKSELIRQVVNEINRELAGLGRYTVIWKNYSVGREIVTQSDLHEALRDIQKSREQNSDCLHLVSFDEIDKAKGFDFFTPFLSLLESRITPDEAVTGWLFVQSSFQSLRQMTAYAEAIENKSLRDFLTRIQGGNVELPNLRFSPVQRLVSGVGILRSLYREATGLSFGLAAYLLSEYRIENIRSLFNAVSRNSRIDSEKHLQLANAVFVHPLTLRGCEGASSVWTYFKPSVLTPNGSPHTE